MILKNIFLNIFLLNYYALVFGLYEYADDIVLLTDFTFDHVILHNRDVWVVEYYAPWCPYCRRFVPEMRKLARLKRNFQVAAIDADQNNEIADRYNISKFPTIKIFRRNKRIPPKTYDGKLYAVNIASAAKKLV